MTTRSYQHHQPHRLAHSRRLATTSTAARLQREQRQQAHAKAQPSALRLLALSLLAHRPTAADLRQQAVTLAGFAFVLVSLALAMKVLDLALGVL